MSGSPCRRYRAQTSFLALARYISLAVPWATLITSLIIVVHDLGITALWTSVAHESEPRSLLAVALFPGHMLREVPHILLFAIVWSASWSPPADLSQAARRLREIVCRAVPFVAAIFVWATLEAGRSSAWIDLSQARLTPDFVLSGVHFRAHIISDVAIAAVLCAAGSTLRRIGMASARGFSSMVVTGAVLLAFGMGVFGVSDISSPRFIGHSAREVFTYTLIIIPVLIFFALRDRSSSHIMMGRPGPEVFIPAAVALVAIGYLATLAVRQPLLQYSADPTRSAPLNLAVHNFEHMLDLPFLLVLTRSYATHSY